MTLSNIERFNDYAGQVLAALYEVFPTPRPLLPGQFIDGGESAVLDPTGFTGAELTPEAGFFMHTVSWLRSAGYISGSETQHAFSDCVLTPKGLEALNAVPDSLNNPQPLGERMVNAAKGSAKDLLQTAVRELISIGVKTMAS
ncbi:hypothetical protein [Trinickia mobilis]|uniref:hypothetical protein n=1 Tax=Trinickia mobilis TaxID=2816356 RepID=UPI001A8E5457|nr:hypothetical protein [Trinickia mobilis]